MNKLKILINKHKEFISYGFWGGVTTTLCAFTTSVEKTGTIETKELSTTLLEDTDFLTKVQTMDQTITSSDKSTDLTKTTSIAQEKLID